MLSEAAAAVKKGNTTGVAKHSLDVMPTNVKVFLRRPQK
jgi:hypothetical protein